MITIELFRLFGSIFVDNEEANRSISDTGDRAEKTSGTFGKMGEATKKLGGFLGGALVAGAGAALAGLGGLLKVGGDLTSAMNRLQQQTGVTDEELQGMEESLKNIYKANYGESFEDISTAMANVKQVTGATGEELENMTQNALMMRDTFDFEVNESMRTVSVMMKNFGITSDEAFTLLAQGQQMGVNASEDLLDTFLEYSPIFNQLGFDAEGMLNVLNTGMQAGARNSDVLADTIKEFGIRVKDGSTASADAFALIGLSADEMANKFAKGGDSAQLAFSETMAAIASIEDPIARNTAGVGLFGTKFEDLEYQAVLALGNVENVANMSGDTLAKINEIKYDSLGEALQGVGRNLLMGVFDPFQQKVMPIVNEFANWIAEKMPVVEEITNKTFTTIFDVADKVWQFFKDNILPIFELYFNNVQSQMPMIKETFQTVFNAIWEVAKTVWEFFKDNILPIFKNLYEWIQGHMPTIRSTFETVFNKIKDVANMVWSFFKNNILPILASLFSYIQSKMPQIQSIVETVFKAIKNVVETVWDLFANFLLPILKGLWEFIEPTFPLIGEIIKTAFDIVIGVVEGVITVFEKVTNAIKTAVEWLTSWNDKDVKDKNVNVNTNYSTSGGIPDRNATGTNHFQGGRTLVGEMGPELITLPKGTKIDPANETKRKLSGSGGITQHITINSPTPLSPSEIARKNLQTSRILAMEWGY